MPLFDPGRIAEPEGEPSPCEPKAANGTPGHPLTVTQLARGITDVLDMCFPEVWVVGQVSGYKRAASGHLYFDLKDERSQVACVMWREQASRMGGRVEDGNEVIACGHVGFYPAGGRCQLYVTRLRPLGVGALEIKFRELKQRLETEGLFSPDRKQPLPMSPQTVAVVTSPTGAAIRDIIHVLSRRWPGLHILLYPVRVQGGGAAQEIARAVARLDRHLSGKVEVMIVGRGGGSAEDLWAFNEEVVARAIAACGIPVVSAVGHETDFSISDFVADVRAPTPSAAAEIVVPDQRELLQRIGVEARRLQRAIDQVVRDARHRLSIASRHRFFRYPEEIAGLPAARLDDLAGRMAASGATCIDRDRRRLHNLQRRLIERRPTARLAAQGGRLAALTARHDAAGRRVVETVTARVDQAAQRLEALSPLAVLERGYSITLAARTGRPVRSAGQVAEGDILATIVSNQERIRSKVTK